MTDEDRTTEIENSPGQISQKRRTLIKSAAVAAPVVLTLRSGAALANASSHQCIARNETEARNADPLLTPNEAQDDMWFRQTVSCKKLKKQNVPGFWVFQDPNNSDQWIHEDDPSRRFVKHPNPNKPKRMKEIDPDTGGLKPGGFKIKKDNETCEVLVLVYEENGEVKIGGYGKPGLMGPIPATDSCWGSFPTPIP